MEGDANVELRFVGPSGPAGTSRPSKLWAQVSDPVLLAERRQAAHQAGVGMGPGGGVGRGGDGSGGRGGGPQEPVEAEGGGSRGSGRSGGGGGDGAVNGRSGRLMADRAG